jgi:hypothetical protein
MFSQTGIYIAEAAMLSWGGGGAQRPILRNNELKKTMRGQNPLIFIIFIILYSIVSKGKILQQHFMKTNFAWFSLLGEKTTKGTITLQPSCKRFTIPQTESYQ